jgi:hypothetical protein
MTRRTIQRLVFVLTTMSVVQVGKAVDEPSKPNCEINFVAKVPSKPPANNFYLKLTLRNPADKPCWFVLPYFGNDSLKSATIRFFDRPANDPPFSSSRYKGKDGDAVIVGCFGSTSAAESFNAFLLPPRSEVVFEEYEIMTFGDVLEGLEVSEVSTILVNGKTPLEKWLPYSLTSSNRAYIPKRGDRDVLDFDRKTYKKRTDYPNEPAESVVFKSVRKTFLRVQTSTSNPGITH